MIVQTGLRYIHTYTIVFWLLKDKKLLSHFQKYEALEVRHKKPPITQPLHEQKTRKCFKCHSTILISSKVLKRSQNAPKSLTKSLKFQNLSNLTIKHYKPFQFRLLCKKWLSNYIFFSTWICVKVVDVWWESLQTRSPVSP